MNGQEEDHGDGDAAVEDQDNGEPIQDHAEQTGGQWSTMMSTMPTGT